MSVARTARRRRRQATLGVKGLEQVYGKKKAPHYPGKVEAGVSARREITFREKQKRIALRKKK